MTLQEVIHKIDSLRSELDKLRPIDPEREQRILQKFRLDWNFHSNNLEGNSLTFGETKTFLLHGITAQGKPLKDHLDIKGHNEAILLLEDVVKNERPLTESFIRELHKVILHEPYDSPAVTAEGNPTTKRIQIGQYKSQPNHVKTQTGEIFYFATPEETPAKMNDLMDWFNKAVSDSSIHPLLLAAEYHYQFIRIHPFDDGNGRMARILMNLIFMMKGFPPVIIKTQEKEEYFRALRQADGGNTEAFISYVGEQLVRSLDLMVRGARGEEIEEEDDVDKEIALFKARLNEKDNNVRIERSKATQLVLFTTWLSPLLEIVFDKLFQFNELFSANRLDIFKDNQGFEHESKDAMLNTVFQIVNDDTGFSSLRLYFYWDNFKKDGINTFSTNVELQIRFYNLKYEVRTPFDKADKIIRLYHDVLEERERVRIANGMAKYILDDIKSKLKNK